MNEQSANNKLAWEHREYEFWKVPLALLGADVTVFDISEENKKYALELADSANVSIQYVVTDIYDIDLEKYSGHFEWNITLFQ